MSQTSWCEGDAWNGHGHDRHTRAGLLYPYDTSPAIYHCPSYISTITDAAAGNQLPQSRVRSYNMSQSVNGYPKLIDPQTGYYVGTYQPCFTKLSSITNPSHSRLFVFIDEI